MAKASKLSIKDRITKGNQASELVYERIREFERSEEETSKAFKHVEEAKYEQFLHIASNAKFFSLDHIDALGLEYDILIFVSEKNIGKTTAIYRKLAEAKAEGKKSIFLRIQMKEVESQMNHFNTDSLSPFYCAKNGSMFFFFDKQDYESLVELENNTQGNKIIKIKYSKALDMGLEPWGFATYFGACNTTAGGSYENYKYIFIDEFITWAKYKVFTKGSFENWTAFPSSIARNKKELKIMMFGNLKDTNNEILNFYGIKDNDNLRYIRRGFTMCSKHRKKYGYVWSDKCTNCPDCEPPCRILYINADTVYRGVKRQSAIVRQARPKELATTLSNKVVTSSTLVITPDLFDEFKPVNYLCYEVKYSDPILIEIRKAYTDRESSHIPEVSLAVRVIPFEAHHIYSLPIKTESTALYNKFRNVVRVPSLSPIIKDLWLFAHSKKLYYYDDETLDMISRILVNFAKSNSLPF